MKIDQINQAGKGFIRFLELYLQVEVEWGRIWLAIDSYDYTTFSLNGGYNWYDNLDFSSSLPPTGENSQ